MITEQELPARFIEKIDVANCWRWTGCRNEAGYGRYAGALAHRFIYTVLVGPIPAGMHLDHLCRVRDCVNPDHLEPVSPRENWLRGASTTLLLAQRTHCGKGHEFTERNTHRRASGSRVCKRCASDQALDYYYRVVKKAGQ